MKKLVFSTISTVGVASMFVTTALAQTPTVTLRQQVKQEIKTLRESMKGKVVRLSKATITSVGTTSITISASGKVYTVNITGATNLRRHYFGKSTLSEMSVNDQVDVIGVYADDTQTTITARLVRDTSIMKRRGVFFGTVSSISKNSLTLASKERGNQTVTVSSATKYINIKGSAITLADISSGDTIRVRGLWDKVNNTITEVTEIKDFSQGTPPTPTK